MIKRIIYVLIIVAIYVLFFLYNNFFSYKTVDFGEFSVKILRKSEYKNNISQREYASEIKESYYVNKFRVYSVIYIKYKDEYSSYINLNHITDEMLRNMEESSNIKNFTINRKEYINVLNMDAYDILCSFNMDKKDKEIKALVIYDKKNNSLLQVIGLYNKGSFISIYIIDKMINSVTLKK